MMRWYAVHARPSSEAKAADNLKRQGYATYLPRHRRWVRHARRREIVLRPLFPRYLFVGIDRDAMPWLPVLSTVGVASVVCGADGPTPVPDAVIDLLRRHEREGAFDELAPARCLQAGDRVRIAEGAFENIVGRLVAAGDTDRVLILFDLLGRQVRAEVAAAAVEAA